MLYNNIKEVLAELTPYIPPFGGAVDLQFQLDRSKYLMSELGDPQEQLYIIHIAGTSGKGSTAQYCSQMLGSQGKKVGLTISPHLVDIRERAYVNNQLLDEKSYIGYFSHVFDVVKRMEKTKWGKPTFFEITMALAFYIFEKEKVDYAIIETGLGGRYDASNVVSRADKLCIITPIGFDHTEFLGNTLKLIAGEKAGIIQKRNHVIVADQESESLEAINKAVKENEATLQLAQKQIVSSSFTFPSIDAVSSISNRGLTFTWQKPEGSLLENIILSSPAQYQVENAALALSAIYFLAKRDQWDVNEDVLLNSLASTTIAGRFEVREIKGKTVIFDGAHNPQKMSAFLTSLISAYPDKKFDFLLAFSATKDHETMLHQIIPFADHITFTEFGEGDQGMHLRAADAKMLSDSVTSRQFTVNSNSGIQGDSDSAARLFSSLSLSSFKVHQVTIESKKLNCDVQVPAQEALEDLLKRSKSTIVVTGSLYLLSELYNECDIL